MSLNKLSVRIRQVLMGLGVAGMAVFQTPGCTIDADISGLDSVLGFLDPGSSYSNPWQYDEPCWDQPETVDPLGLDIDLPYFDEGDYFEVPAGLF